MPGMSWAGVIVWSKLCARHCEMRLPLRQQHPPVQQWCVGCFDQAGLNRATAPVRVLCCAVQFPYTHHLECGVLLRRKQPTA